MLARTLLLACLITTPALAQSGARSLFGPPKPRVISTPPPAPAKEAATPAPKRRAKPRTVESTTDASLPTEPGNERLAPYVAKVKAAFAKRWGAAVTPLLSDFSPGNLSSTFKLDAEGKVTAFNAVENTSNEAFLKFCDQFVRETEFEKPPVKLLTDGQVEIPFNFSIF